MARKNTTTDAQAPARKTRKSAQAVEPEIPQAVEPEIPQAVEPEIPQAVEPGYTEDEHAMMDAMDEAGQRFVDAISTDVQEEGPGKIERSWPNTDEIEVSCPECEHGWIPKILRLSIQCPKCGAWVKVRIKADLTKYVRGLGVTPSGHDTLDIGDDTADSLRGLTVPEILDTTAAEIVQIGKKHASKAMRKAVREASGSDAWDFETILSFLSDRYASRNNGMVRMNCGNILRGMRNRAA